MAYSSLTKKLMPAYEGNYTAGRQTAISEITIHHTRDVLSLEQLGRLWQRVGREGSSHYGVRDDEVYCYVSEGDTAWTNSNWRSNCRAITIETVNSSEGGDWPVSDASIETLIKLVADIASRKGLGMLKVGENLTYHSMYTATACPGPYLRSRLQYIADRANEINYPKDKQDDEVSVPYEEVIAELEATVCELEKANAELERAVEGARTYAERIAQLEKDVRLAAPYMEKAVKLEMEIVEKNKTIEGLEQQVKVLQRDVREAIPYAEECVRLAKENGVLKETIVSLQEKMEAVTKENEALKLECEMLNKSQCGCDSSDEPRNDNLLVRIFKILFGGA